MHVLKRLSTWLVLLFLLSGSIVSTASAADYYLPTVEWSGTYMHVMNGSGIYDQQPVDDPVVDVPFVNSNGVVVWDDAAGSYITYVIDSFHDRVQSFDTDIAYGQETLTFNAPPGVGQFGDDGVDTDDMIPNNTAGNLVPGSEKITVDGVVWTRVDDLTGYTVNDNVYVAVYGGAAAVNCLFSTVQGRFAGTEVIEVDYLQGNAFSAADLVTGNIDYGPAAAAAVNGLAIGDMLEINETIPNNDAQSFENLVAIAYNVATAAADQADIYILDAGEIGTVDPKVQTYLIEDDAATTFQHQDTYDGPMDMPLDVAIDQKPVGTDPNVLAIPAAPTAFVGATVPPAVDPTITITNSALFTNDDYTVAVTTWPAGAAQADMINSVITVTNTTRGNTVIIDTITVATPAGAHTFSGWIPGADIVITTDALMDFTAVGTSTITMTGGTLGENNDYIFVADTGNDRIKVIKGADNGAAATNGAEADFFEDDNTVTETYDIIVTAATDSIPNLTYVTGTRPMEDSFNLFTRNAGTTTTWTMVDNFAGSLPTDNHYMYDYDTGVILLGDGNFGEIPTTGDTLYSVFNRCLDIDEFGRTGAGDDMFNAPAGVASRWNGAQGWFDIYVADTGNNRIAKLKYVPPATNGAEYSIDWVTSWTTAFTGSNLDSPTDIQVLENTNTNQVYIFTCDTGNDRVVIWRDTAAEADGDGVTAPTFETAFGATGAVFGTFAHPTGISVIENASNEFEIYVADAERNVVVKYMLGATPLIDVDYSNIETFGYLPTGSYTFEPGTYDPIFPDNHPTGSYIQFFYSDTTTAGQADPTLCSSTQYATTITSFQWVFANTPTGTPADGDYYLYARLYDANGVFLAEDKSATAALTIDSDLLIGIGAFDEFDDDLYLYVQNNSQRMVNLDVMFPDSVAAVSWGGTFPSDKMTIVTIEEGPGWQTVQNQGVIFEADWDNTNGTWEVNTSVLGSNTGLVSGPAKFTLGVMTVLVASDAITPDNRFYLGTIDITSGSWADYKGEDLGEPQLNDLALNIGYLGDIADPDVAYGTVPSQIPTPDGIFGYDDVLVFTLGWNGLGGTQDPIADLGPYNGTIPDLWAAPNGVLDVQDLLAFTLMFEWYRDNFSPALASFDPAPIKVENKGQERTTADFFAEHLTTEVREVGNQRIVEIHAVDVEELMAAELSMYYSSAHYTLDSYTDGGFLSEDANLFFNGAELDGGGLNLIMSRLNQDDPGVSGSGMLAEIVLNAANDTENFTIEFSLHNAIGEVIENGVYSLDVTLESSALPTEFTVSNAYPNPFNPTSVVSLGIPTAGNVEIAAYNVLGQRVFKQVNFYNAGYHQFVFNASHNGHSLAGGIYFLKVDYNDQVNVQKVVLLK